MRLRNAGSTSVSYRAQVRIQQVLIVRTFSPPYDLLPACNYTDTIRYVGSTRYSIGAAYLGDDPLPYKQHKFPVFSVFAESP